MNITNQFDREGIENIIEDLNPIKKGNKVMKAGFYGTYSQTFLVTRTGKIWVIDSEDGYQLHQINRLPSEAKKLADKSVDYWLQEEGNEAINDFVIDHIDQ